MIPKFKRKVWISFSIILASVGLAAGAFYYYSTELSSSADIVVKDRGILNDQNDALSNLATLKKDSATAGEYTAAIDKLLSDQNGLVGFGPWLDQLAKKNNVTESFSFVGDPAPSTPSTPGTVNFSVQAQGTLSNTKEFLQDIESQSSGFLVNIASLDILNSNGNVHLTAQGTIFFR